MPFDPQAASLYGQFVQAAYTMYDSAPDNTTPPTGQPNLESVGGTWTKGSSC